MEKLTTNAFMPVRRNPDGHEYVAYWTSAGDRFICREKTELEDKQIPAWAKENPVVRIAEFEIKEI